MPFILDRLCTVFRPSHRKLVVADALRMFAGGMNGSSHYMEADFDCDLAYHLSDHAVARFCDIHQSDWTVASGTATDPINRGPPQRGHTQLQIVPSGRDMAEDKFHDALVHAIRAASDLCCRARRFREL